MHFSNVAKQINASEVPKLPTYKYQEQIHALPMLLEWSYKYEKLRMKFKYKIKICNKIVLIKKTIST